MTKLIKPADWLLDAILQPSTKNRSHEGSGTTVPFMSEGSRNADLTSLGGFLVRRGVVGEKLENQLQSANEAIPGEFLTVRGVKPVRPDY